MLVIVRMNVLKQYNLTNRPVLRATSNASQGVVINFKLPSILTRELDSNYSGNYLITAVRHIIRPEGGSESIIEIAKDSEVAKTNVVNNPVG